MDKRKEQEAAEKDFKENMFKIFSEHISGTEYDEESGIITVPIIERTRMPHNSQD